MSRLHALLDASLNRAREAARVLEDQARFLHHDAPRAKDWQDIRRRLGEVAARFGPLTPARNVAADPGARDESATPRDAATIGTANAKRLQEALRSIEEHAKALKPALAPIVAKLRFAAYEAEQKSGATSRLASIHLMALLTESQCRLPWLETARLLLRGGVDAIQLREKQIGDREFLRRARALKRFTPCLVLNDRAGLVELCGADGVHLGTDDMTVADARRLVGPSRIIGATVHGPRKSVAGADYVSAGPVFATSQKPDLRPAGLAAVRAAARDPLPFFAIGGITPENVRSVVKAGGNRIAVGAALCGAADPEQAARKFKSALK